MKSLLKIFIFILPWFFKRKLLISFFGYKIHPKARIGLSWIFPYQLIMEEGSYIGHFNVAIHLDCIHLEKNSKIGRSNWITGFTTKSNHKHFQHQKQRESKLIIGKHTAITKKHHLDCTNYIKIGKYSTIAGYGSQLLTHSIDVYENRQSSAPINIGDYTFVSTDVVILGGANLPNNSVLGAKALLNKPYKDEWVLYGGVPAKQVGEIDKKAKYFKRQKGFVN